MSIKEIIFLVSAILGIISFFALDKHKILRGIVIAMLIILAFILGSIYSEKKQKHDKDSIEIQNTEEIHQEKEVVIQEGELNVETPAISNSSSINEENNNKISENDQPKPHVPTQKTYEQIKNTADQAPSRYDDVDRNIEDKTFISFNSFFDSGPEWLFGPSDKFYSIEGINSLGFVLLEGNDDLYYLYKNGDVLSLKDGRNPTNSFNSYTICESHLEDFNGNQYNFEGDEINDKYSDCTLSYNYYVDYSQNSYSVYDKSDNLIIPPGLYPEIEEMVGDYIKVFKGKIDVITISTNSSPVPSVHQRVKYDGVWKVLNIRTKKYVDIPFPIDDVEDFWYTDKALWIKFVHKNNDNEYIGSIRI